MASDLSNLRLYQLVRDFAIRTPGYTEAIRYYTKPDERLDLTLVSSRVYGNRGEFLAIQAAAGLDSPEQEMSERLLTLPTPQKLADLKLQAGFGTDVIR